MSLNLNVNKFWMWLKLECDSNWNVTQNLLSLKIQPNSKWNVTQTGMSVKIKCHLNLNITPIGRLNKLKKVVNRKTSKRKSIGRISILFLNRRFWFITPYALKMSSSWRLEPFSWHNALVQAVKDNLHRVFFFVNLERVIYNF